MGGAFININTPQQAENAAKHCESYPEFKEGITQFLTAQSAVKLTFNDGLRSQSNPLFGSIFGREANFVINTAAKDSRIATICPFWGNPFVQNHPYFKSLYAAENSRFTTGFAATATATAKGNPMYAHLPVMARYRQFEVNFQNYVPPGIPSTLGAVTGTEYEKLHDSAYNDL